jgi:hypothetical protein
MKGPLLGIISVVNKMLRGEPLGFDPKDYFSNHR